MKLNLSDIAQLAGVSQTTVSRVINHHPDVSDATREKVQKIIQEHNYHPNLVARMLVTQKTNILGVVICDPYRAFGSYYTSILFQGINEVTDMRDYATLTWWQRPKAEPDRFTERVLQQHRLMDGMLISSAGIKETLTERLMEMNIPFVMLERPSDSRAEEITYITIDNIKSAREAVEHLIRLGRRHIAHIVGLPTNLDGQDRLEGYRQALEVHDMPFDPELVADGAFSRESGIRAMTELLERDVDIDAVFAGNDEIADGALLVLYRHGIRIPEDIALIGFDDVPLAQQSIPQLTTVRQPIFDKGVQATTLLLNMINGKVTEPQHIILPTELVIRESCGANLREGRDYRRKLN